MGRLSAKLRSVAGNGDRRGIMHWCPGCDSPHAIWTAGAGPVWSYDGNVDAPTFNPSVLCFTTDEKGQRETLCHYFLHASRIAFCGDSPHKLSGQTVDLPDWPYAEGEYGGA